MCTYILHPVVSAGKNLVSKSTGKGKETGETKRRNAAENQARSDRSYFCNGCECRRDWCGHSLAFASHAEHGRNHATTR